MSSNPNNNRLPMNGSGRANGSVHANSSIPMDGTVPMNDPGRANGSFPMNGPSRANGSVHFNGSGRANGGNPPHPMPPNSQHRPTGAHGQANAASFHQQLGGRAGMYNRLARQPNYQNYHHNGMSDPSVLMMESLMRQIAVNHAEFRRCQEMVTHQLNALQMNQYHQATQHLMGTSNAFGALALLGSRVSSMLETSQLTQPLALPFNSLYARSQMTSNISPHTSASVSRQTSTPTPTPTPVIDNDEAASRKRKTNVGNPGTETPSKKNPAGSSSRTPAKAIPFNKDKSVEKTKFRENSLQFKLETDLEYAMQAYGDQFSNASLDAIKEFLNGKKAGRANPHYLRTPITFNARLPDEDNYRGCNEYIEELTIGTCEPICHNNNNEKSTRTAPPFSLFGSLLFKDINISADDVQKKALNWFSSGRNEVYESSDMFCGPKPNEMLVEHERRFYKEKYGDTSLDGFTGDDRNRIQTPVLKVENRDDLENENLKRILNSASITVVSGICKAAGIDASLFDIDVLAEIDTSLMVDCLYQIPQSADDNFNVDGKRMWKTTSITTEKLVRWVSSYFKERYRVAKDYLKKMADSNDLKETAEEIIHEMVNEQGDLPEKADKSMYWSVFASNVDMEYRATYRDQYKELDKLPEFLRPKFDGNLLNLMGEDVLGVSTPQVFVKAPGARTAAHMENALMASININLGPGTCVWFAVPYEYWGRLEGLVKSNGLTYHSQNYWPDEEELRAEGIPVYKFEQLPGELVHVNVGCFHWVQSNGYCTNIAWNIGQPTAVQMGVAMIAKSHNYLCKYQDHIPLIRMAWKIAKDKLFLDNEELYKVVRSILIRSLAHNIWYEEELLLSGKEIATTVESSKSTPPQMVRCEMCGTEVFNIIKWYVADDHVMEDICLCSRCKPTREVKNKRKEMYSMYYCRETLMEMMDAYRMELSNESDPQ